MSGPILHLSSVITVSANNNQKLSLPTLLSLHLYNDDNIFRAQEECSEQLVHIQPPTTLPLHPIYGAPPGQGGQWAPCAEIPTGKM